MKIRPVRVCLLFFALFLRMSLQASAAGSAGKPTETQTTDSDVGVSGPKIEELLGDAEAAPTATGPIAKESGEAKGSSAKPVPDEIPATDVMPAPMRFDKVPLDAVARILSARLGKPVTIDAHGDHLVSGDFSHGDLKIALTEVAAQAGLTPIFDKTGITLALARPKPTAVVPVVHAKVEAKGKSAVERAADEKKARILKEAAAKRARLLQERAKLSESLPDSKMSK